MFCLAIATVIPAYQAVTVAMTVAVVSGDRQVSLHNKVLQGVRTDFKIRSNVYFFLLDGYTSVAGLKLLGLLNDEKIAHFYPTLQDRGFTIYPEFFTNFQKTRHAVPAYLNMDIKHRGNSIYRSSASVSQEIVANSNPVYKIFYDNDYDINIVLSDNYLVGNRCRQCLIGSSYEGYLRYFELFDKIITQNKIKNLFKTTNHSFHRWAIFHQQSHYHKQHVRKTHFVLTQLGKLTNNSNHLTFVHLYLPYHTDHNGRCDEEHETKKYAERLYDTHRVMLSEIERISAIDQQAIIVLAGDHGPYIFNRCAENPVMRTVPETIEPQGAFLAVRWGNNYDGRYDQNIKSSANLFRYIFSFLMEHEQLLANKPPDDAFTLVGDQIVKTIDDGVVIPYRER